MIRLNWKVSILFVFLTTVFSATILPSTGFAHGTPQIPHYIPCSRVIDVTKVTQQNNNYTGVKLTGSIIAEMDSQDITIYCGTLKVRNNVATSHTGKMVAGFTPPNAIENTCRTFNKCAITGTNNFTLYEVQRVAGGTSQCTDIQFFDDNGNLPAVYPCWKTPSVKHHR